MSRVISHFRRNWGKYLFLSSVTSIGSYFGYNRYCDTMIMSQLCRQASRFQAQRHEVAEPLEKVYVLFNPSANRGKARKHFNRYAAPILYLSGADVTILELESEQHLREMVNYLPPNTGSIIVAGGSGTLLNVVTALLRRNDHLKEWDKVTLGFIPLGYRNGLRGKIMSNEYQSRAERIAKSVLVCLEGRSKPVDVMELITEEGKTVYAMTDVLWGPLVEGTLVANRYGLLGPLRGLFGYLRHAFKSSTNEEIGIDKNDKQQNLEISGLAVSAKNGKLSFRIWEKIESKLEFAKFGAKQMSYKTPADFLEYKLSTPINELKIQPIRDSDYWFHIDGDEFEPYPVQIRILNNKIKFFTDELLNTNI
ncbi:Acylglycerol kinase, mitochondrial isoform X1 [Oopsacas minuta]|uniref:Acylglycerol kinase, mitochondrial isoform X1 n=1 Tax=Oopsacas minuta TaxID=111878 RepID=A0AAV7JEC8_9METZ|nr:Acylglycerol kinase, mitochondrial isoform X1 [Oopsacas minuta]